MLPLSGDRGIKRGGGRTYIKRETDRDRNRMGNRFTERETKTETNTQSVKGETHRQRSREREIRMLDVCTASQGITYSV